MDVFLVRRANGWHVEERRGGRVTDYGPFRVKRRALDMRNAIIESDLQRNAPMPKREKMYTVFGYHSVTGKRGVDARVGTLDQVRDTLPPDVTWIRHVRALTKRAAVAEAKVREKVFPRRNPPRRRRNTHIPKPAERKLAALVRQYGTANVIGEAHEIAGKRKRNPLYAELTAGRQGGGFGIGYRRRPKENPRRVKRRRNAALHGVKVIGSNMIEVDHGSLYALYSYETPVAVRPREGAESRPLVTSTFHSRTTSKHIGVWLRSHGYTITDAVRVSQEEIDAIVKRGFHRTPNPYSAKARFRHTRVRAPRRFAKGSMRTVTLPGGKAVVLGHLKGERRRTKAGRVKQTVQAILTPKRSRRSVRRKNPVLGILGNPPGAPHGTFLGKASYIEYTHATMAGGKKHYYHDFIPAAYVIAKPNGNMELYHPENRLWKVFPVPAKDVRRGVR